MKGAGAQGSTLWSHHCLTRSGAAERAGRRLQAKSSFRFAKGSLVGTRICQCLALCPWSWSYSATRNLMCCCQPPKNYVRHFCSEGGGMHSNLPTHLIP